MDIKWPPNTLMNFLHVLYEQRKRKLLELLNEKKFGTRKLVWPNAYVVAMHTPKVERKKIKEFP